MALVFSDNFTGLSGTALNGRTGTGGSGAWSGFGVTAADQNGLKINAANQARVATSNGCLARVETGAADHYAKAALYVTTAAAAVAVRATDHLNFLGFRIVSSTQVELFKRVNSATEGSVAKVTVGAITLPAVLELRASGSNALLFLNGAQVGAAGGYAIDPALPASTKAGLWGKSSAADPVADDFESGVLVTSVSVAGGRGVARDRGQALALALGLAPAGGRAPGRGGAAWLTGIVVSPVVAAAGRTPLRGAPVALTGLANALLVPAGARSAGRAGAAAAGLMLGIGAAGGRSAGRAGVAAAGLTLGIGAAGGRSAGRAGAAAAGLTLGIGAAGGRSAGRAGVAAAGLTLGIGAAGGRSAGRAGVATLSGAVALGTAGGRGGGRAGAAVLTIPSVLAPVGARVATRSRGAGVARFMAGFQTGVDAETRTVPVLRP